MFRKAKSSDMSARKSKYKCKFKSGQRGKYLKIFSLCFWCNRAILLLVGVFYFCALTRSVSDSGGNLYLQWFRGDSYERYNNEH